MQVHSGIDQLPTFKSPVLTIGSFDGVHQGHRVIIKRLVEKANEIGGESVILSFHPHPRQVVFPNDDSMKLLSSLEEKIKLLQETKVDHLVILPFTVEFSQINPYRYVDEVLIEKIGVKHLIIGYDHKFGLNRDGDIDLLRIYERQEKFTVEEIPRQDVDNLRVSSTKIRNHLLDGNIETANLMLGTTYILSGIITKGSQIAGNLGYPTANCRISEKSKLIPGPGTYAATAECNGETYEGMLYIGKSPTLQSRQKDIIEMNLFGKVTESLYEKPIFIFPEKKFRGDQKFNNREALLYNIQQDKIEVEHYFISKKCRLNVSSAILNYNGQQYLENYLPSHSNSEDNKVVVIDNNSEDDSVNFINSNFPNVRIIALDKNHGFAGGYNEGLKAIGTKYTAIVNSDVRVSEGWLDPLIHLLEKDNSIAAVQPKILSIAEPEKFEYAGAAGGFVDRLNYPFCRGRMLDQLENDNGQYDDASEVFWTSGAAMVIRTDLFKAAGGFDADFFAHMEEIDLCWRLKNAGYRLCCEPKSTVFHLGGGTLAYNSTKKVALNLRNNYWMLLKNDTIGKLLYQLPVRILLDLAYALSFILKFDFRKFGAAFNGILTGFGGIFSISKKRRKNRYFQKRYGIGTPTLSGRRNIILPFAFYIGGKRTFSNLK